VGEVLAARVADAPDDLFLVVDHDRLTYGEADERSAELARRLLAADLGHGSRVGLLHRNGPAFAVAWLAAARIGAVTVPLSTFSTDAELRGLLRGSDVTLLLAGEDHPADLRGEGLPMLRRVASGADDLPEPVTVDVLADAESLVTAADPMVVVHTSGSTAEPKGVVHTHGALVEHLGNLNGLRRLVPGEVLFSPSPWFWIGGFAYALLGTLVAGSTLVTSNARDAAAVLDLLERERPTMVNGFAATVAHLAEDPSFGERDLSSIRRGNLWPILPDGVRPADPGLRHGMLGLTEAGSVCLAGEDESDQPESRRGSFGRPVPGFEAELRDGVLWLRGPYLMEGYLGRERHETFDADGWFATGDLFTVDDDGWFHFHGRAGDVIKTAGANVSPPEVEAAILEVAGLAAHVVGVDDDARGQVVAALVRGPADLDVDDLRARLRDRLSAYKVPRTIVVVTDDGVPMLSSGKVDLRAVRELLGAA
jgi:acyl-CoA synthetase (AMP-forming)/AMP-acid ligase II